MRSHDFAQWQDSSLPQESATPPQLSLIGVASRAEFRGAAKNEQTIKGDANVSAPSDAAYAQHRAELIALAASHISKTKDLDTFKANIDDFEKRMAANSRRDAQVDGTYQQIARLFSDSDQTTVPLKLRVRLAQQAMDHAAHRT